MAVIQFLIKPLLVKLEWVQTLTFQHFSDIRIQMKNFLKEIEIEIVFYYRLLYSI